MPKHTFEAQMKFTCRTGC